jgi:hypothetical protein
MNPEFRRNLWLELTPRRMILAAVLLALAFFAAAASGGRVWNPATVATWIYYGVVVLWGSRNAALSVVGEIRERTWDAQRLSSLGAGAMTWGKLFGATIYNWYVGGICLAVILAHTIASAGIVTALIDFVYFLAIGVVAQAAAFLASLIAVSRRQSHSRAEIFLYQLAGIAAAIAAFWVWETADPAGSILAGNAPTRFIVWWGHAFDARPFLLVSLALFTAWTLAGCYREMRLELKMANGPLVWLGFLIFIGVYAAGFDRWLSHSPQTASWDAVALRLGLAASTFATLTYIAVFLEPKNRVHFRWLGTQLVQGRIFRMLWGLQSFMMSYGATALVSALLMWWLWAHAGDALGTIALIAAGLGFITRDVALFVLLHALPGGRRWDVTAVLALLALYLLIPAILNGLGLGGTLVFFYPTPSLPLWLSPAFAWAEAVGLVVLALGRIALSEKPVRVEPAAA